jgi:PAS domain S-box-containing protein
LTVALLVAPSFTTLDAGLPFAVIIGLIWFLGLARNVHFQVRAAIFLILVYIMAFVEMYNFGFSVESFTFFMALVVSATLLMERKGGIVTIVISVATLCAFAVAVGGGYYLPISAHEGIPVPANIQRGLTSAIVFAASAAAMLGSITILMESLNSAWRLESQALNLLQQERDLLEQRVNERTQALSEARDQAVIVSNQMRKYYRAMEQSGATVVITDLQGNIEYANPMFEQTTGYKLSDAIGKNPRILKSDAHPKDYYDNLWQTISSGNVWHGEFLNKRKDGSLYWESATIAPVLDANGAVSNYVAIKEDVTAQKQLQDSLVLAHGQALEASRLKSQLLSRVSHELRTPLGSVLGYAELVRGGAYGAVNDEQTDPLKQIIDSANYLTSLVNDLLDEAQIETRNLSLNMSAFSLRAVLQSVNDRMIVLAKNKGLNFDLEIESAIPDQLYGDEKRVQQILVNLSSNAIKFTKSGGMGIRVFQPVPMQWAAQVWDTGAGIPKESQEEIFMPFRQLNNNITRENRGTGLGLSIVKQIVEIMGGSIQLESELYSKRLRF